MTTPGGNPEFRYYMHEGPEAFSFEVAGVLSDNAARELEQVRHSASPVIQGRSLIIDLSYVTRIEPAARTMLRRWHSEGAQLVARSEESKAIVRSVTGQPQEAVPSSARYHTWRPFFATLWALALMVGLAPPNARAADLKPEAVQAWDAYIQSVSAREQTRLAAGASLLALTGTAAENAKLRRGEILVSPANAHVPIKVPSGLIHHWVGSAFVPDATIPDVLSVVRDYECYKDVYHPNVVDSKPTAMGNSEDRFSLRLINKSVLARTALQSEYRSTYTRLDDRHWYSITESTRIQEIADFGNPAEHALPENQGSGVIWRLYSIARFEQRDGGVQVEVEAIALSRDIPVALRWVVDPIVRRVSRSSLTTSLEQTRNAVRSGGLAGRSIGGDSSSGLARSFR